MISIESFQGDHIRTISERYKLPPQMIFNNICALFLTQNLSSVGLPFVLRGGLSMQQILATPVRPTSDVDILVEPDLNIDQYLAKIAILLPFDRIEEEKREAIKKMKKRHFKCFYKTGRRALKEDDQAFIYLDVVFEKDCFRHTLIKNLHSTLAITTEDYPIKVVIPTPEKILSEKLTMLGIQNQHGRLFRDLADRMMCQLWDCDALIDYITEPKKLREQFDLDAQRQMHIYGLTLSTNEMLYSIFQHCLTIISGGEVDQREYEKLKNALDRVSGTFLEKGNIYVDTSKKACRIAYLISGMLIPDNFSLSLLQNQSTSMLADDRAPDFLRNDEHLSELRTNGTYEYRLLLSSIKSIESYLNANGNSSL